MSDTTPADPAVTLSTGDIVTVRPPAWPYLAALEGARAGFAAVVAALYGTVGGLADDGGLVAMTPDTALDVAPVLAANQTDLCTTLALHTGRAPEWVAGLDLADLIRLVGAVKGCNVRFFTDRLLPGLVDFTWASLNKTPPVSPAPPGPNPPTTPTPTTDAPPA